MRKLYDNVKAAFTLRPQVATTTQTGTGVDTQGFWDGMVVVEVGTVSGTAPTLDIKLQESDDNSTFVDIAGATFTQVTAANSSQVKRVSELGVARKRYLRAVSTIGGTSPSFAHSVEFLLSSANSGAINQD